MSILLVFFMRGTASENETIDTGKCPCGSDGNLPLLSSLFEKYRGNLQLVLFALRFIRSVISSLFLYFKLDSSADSDL